MPRVRILRRRWIDKVSLGLNEKQILNVKRSWLFFCHRFTLTSSLHLICFCGISSTKLYWRIGIFTCAKVWYGRLPFLTSKIPNVSRMRLNKPSKTYFRGFRTGLSSIWRTKLLLPTKNFTWASELSQKKSSRYRRKTWTIYRMSRDFWDVRSKSAIKIRRLVPIGAGRF